MENIRLLLDHGADLLAKDANGMTALDLAEYGDHEQCMAVLKGAAGGCRGGAGSSGVDGSAVVFCIGDVDVL